MTDGEESARITSEQLTRCSRRLRAAMDACGVLSVRALARAAGVSDVTVWHLLSGERPPSSAAVVGLARALGVTTDYLLGADIASPDESPAEEGAETDG